LNFIDVIVVLRLDEVKHTHTHTHTHREREIYVWVIQRMVSSDAQSKLSKKPRTND